MPTPESPLSRRAEFGVIAGFWIIIALLTIIQEAFDPRFSGQETWEFSEAAFAFLKYMIWAILTPVIFWLIRFISQVQPLWKQVAWHGLLGLTATALIHYIYHILWNLLVPASPQSMSLLFVLSGLHFLPEFFLYLVVLAAGFARDYFLRYRERLRETARLQAESASLRADAAELQMQLADARLQALHMQINPHFLFNTLNTVSAYIERDPVGTRRTLTMLSELLRYTFEQTDVKEVLLSRELNFLNKYLDIQTIRFQDRLDVQMDVQPEVLDALIPTLILQPIVENAIKHGMSKREEPGQITINAWQRDHALHITVTDNGPGFMGLEGDGSPPMQSGVGLQNTRNRLATLYGDKHNLVLENIPQGGARVHMILPYHTLHDMPVTSVLD